jgi:BASS family bile acid:Na+ symporter
MGDIIGLVFQLSVAVSVFGYGLYANNEDILYVFRRPRLLVVSLLAMFVVVPVAALAIELYFDFPHAARVAIVVLALTPVSQLLPRTEISSGGRPSYAYGLSFAVASLSIVIVPAMTHFVGRVMGRPFGVPAGTVATTLLLTVLLPLGLGMLAQRLLPNLADRIKDPMVRIANIALLAALAFVLVLVFPSVLDVIGVGTVVAMAVFIAVALAVGHFMGGPDPDHSVVLAIACANRNPGMGIAIAVALFPAENFVATMVLYGILVSVVSKPYINWQKRRLASTSVSVEGQPDAV